LCADAAKDHSALIASEEDQEQIELRATRTGRALGVSIVYSRKLSAALRAIGAPKLLVVDSLHGCTGRPEDNARLVTTWARDTGGAALVVARETKSGSIRGGNDIGYEFDADCTLEIGENDSRFLDVVKCRFGPVGQHPLVLSAYGWTDPPEGSKPIPRPVTGQILYLPPPPGTTPPWTPRARRERARPRR
jgi:predicted ATP-dependent serine protease